MAIKFSDLEAAFDFVFMGQMNMHNAYLCRRTGEVFYTSEMGDSDELPEDFYENENKDYVELPQKNDLDLGKALVLDFTYEYLPNNVDAVYSIFRKRGAYSKFKDLLDSKGLLEKWYSYEAKRQGEALREWCRDNDIETDG